MLGCFIGCPSKANMHRVKLQTIDDCRTAIRAPKPIMPLPLTNLESFYLEISKKNIGHL